jgi:antitoxin component YwqK of YwqJK toxin-antitoxin module
MINIKRLFFVSVFFMCFLSVNTLNAQRINQFDENKKRTGVWKKYYSNKRIRYIGQFKDGKEIGTFKFYSINYSRFPEAIKVFKPGTDSIAVKYFFDNGKLRTTGTFIGKKRVGKWKYFYKNGTVFSTEFYDDGKLEGNVIVYFKSNGKIAEYSEYKNGLMHGLSKKYSDKGVLIEEVLFENGKANGLAKYYELSGSLKERGIYKDGKRIGKWEFYLDGEIVDEKKRKETLKNKIQKKN